MEEVGDGYEGFFIERQFDFGFLGYLKYPLQGIPVMNNFSGEFGLKLVDDPINDLDIKDEETIKAVRETQGMIKGILEEITE